MNKTLRNICALALGLVVTACDDYIDYESKTSSAIRFDVSISDKGSGSDWKSPTRSAEAQDIPVAELKGETSGKTLYLHTEITDFPDACVAGSDGKRTRGAIVENNGDGFTNMYDSFAVSGYYYEDGWTSTQYLDTPTYFTEEQASGSGKSYDLVNTYYWPGQGKMRFLANAPASHVVDGTDCYKLYYHHWTDRGPYIQVLIPENASDQKDLIVAYTKGLDCKTSREKTKLNFKHPLTCVRFAFSEDMVRCRIKKVTMADLKWEADFILDGMQDEEDLSSAETNFVLYEGANYDKISNYVQLWNAPLTKTFTLEPDNYIVTEGGDLITPEDNSFIMLPQTVNGQEVQIVIEQVDKDGNATGAEETITGKLPATVWEPGKIVTYKVSYLDQNLSVEKPYVFNYAGVVYDRQNRAGGGMLDYNPVIVTSYVGSTTEAEPWKMTFSEDGGNTFKDACEWLQADIVPVAGNDGKRLVNFSIPQSYITANVRNVDIDANLRAQSYIGSKTSPVNLSDPSRTQSSTVGSTANSYIVQGPGYYSLPLVYGNAVQGGSEVKKAFTFSGTAQNSVPVLSSFKNYRNGDMKSAYIKTDLGDAVPSSAELLWQDENGLVTSSSVEYVSSAFGGKGGIRFEVPAGSIKQGNAVLVLKDASGTVIWSWHVWVTRFDFDETIPVTSHSSQGGLTYNLMSMNLGWCSAHGEQIRFYPRRSCIVRFTAEDLKRDITIVQESHIAFTRGNNTYYQWGRKDPFIGQTTTDATTAKTWYDASGLAHSEIPALISETLFVTRGNLQQLIQNPGKWHKPPFTGTISVDASSNNATYSNLWMGDASGVNTFYKTVYDPCPVGYQVGGYEPYTMFTADGEGETGDQVNIAKVYLGNPTANLMEFYTNDDKYQSLVFPLTGYRDWVADAQAYIFNAGGHIWTNKYCYWTSIDNAYYFRFVDNAGGTTGGYAVDPFNAYFTCDGFAIRPFAE